MNDYFFYGVLIYFVAISFITAVVTLADKSKARRNKWRVPENTLMLLGLFGGAAAEYITMKIIRHKTKHAKFMIGLPLFILLHIALVILYIYIAK